MRVGVGVIFCALLSGCEFDLKTWLSDLESLIMNDSSEMEPDTVGAITTDLSGSEPSVTADSPVAVMPDISIGTTRADVISQLGEPSGQVMMGEAVALLYDNGSVTLIDDRVSKVQKKTIAEMKSVKQTSGMERHVLSDKQVRHFTEKLEIYKRERDQLERDQRSLRSRLTSLTSSYRSKRGQMLAYRAQCNQSSEGNPFRGDTCSSSYSYRKYMSAYNDAQQKMSEMKDVENQLNTLEARLRNIQGEVNASQSFLRGHEEASKKGSIPQASCPQASCGSVR